MDRIIKAPSAGSPKFRAEAVEFDWNNEVHYVKIRREVIVSAGCVIRSRIPPGVIKHFDSRTVKSPRILQLSGINDESILKPFGITTHVHLPGVRKNL